jgi:hypothetical protein
VKTKQPKAARSALWTHWVVLGIGCLAPLAFALAKHDVVNASLPCTPLCRLSTCKTSGAIVLTAPDETEAIRTMSAIPTMVLPEFTSEHLHMKQVAAQSLGKLDNSFSGSPSAAILSLASASCEMSVDAKSFLDKHGDDGPSAISSNPNRYIRGILHLYSALAIAQESEGTVEARHREFDRQIKQARADFPQYYYAVAAEESMHMAEYRAAVGRREAGLGSDQPTGQTPPDIEKPVVEVQKRLGEAMIGHWLFLDGKHEDKDTPSFDARSDFHASYPQALADGRKLLILCSFYINWLDYECVRLLATGKDTGMPLSLIDANVQALIQACDTRLLPSYFAIALHVAELEYKATSEEHKGLDSDMVDSVNAICFEIHRRQSTMDLDPYRGAEFREYIRGQSPYLRRVYSAVDFDAHFSAGGGR